MYSAQHLLVQMIMLKENKNESPQLTYQSSLICQQTLLIIKLVFNSPLPDEQHQLAHGFLPRIREESVTLVMQWRSSHDRNYWHIENKGGGGSLSLPASLHI